MEKNMKMIGSFLCHGKNIWIFQDCFNNKKKWLVKRTLCGHYYFGQIINNTHMQGKIVAANTGKMIRTTKRHLKEIGIIWKFA